MKAHAWLTLAIPCFCIIALVHHSWAQQRTRTEEIHSRSLSSMGLDFPYSYGGNSEEYRRHDYREWIVNLQEAGILNLSLPNPYRIAMPLMSFGDTGPKVMLTYAKKMPGNIEGKGLLLFITIEIP